MIRFFVTFLNLMILFVTICFGQDTETDQAPLKVAVIAPVYIDSAFQNGVVKNNLPRTMQAGLDFIHGAEIALDTINTKGKKVEAYFFDSKARVKNTEWLIKSGELDDMNLIIGGVKEPEYQQLAVFARQKKIPFISAIYPNDGNIRNDSFLVIMNSTLKSHIEGIFSYIVQKHSMDQILLIKQRNDNRIDNYFKDINRINGKNLLNIKTIAVDSIDSQQLAMLIDTLKPAVVIGATLNEWFALNTADACYPYRDKVTLIGMPNWDGFRDLFSKERYQDFSILFTTPHLDEEKNAFSDYLGNRFFTEYRAKPSDNTIKAFEATWYFINIILEHGDNFLEHLNENKYACFHEFNFRPVVLNKGDTTDYFENKHVFIVQILNGLISKVW